MTRTTFGGKRGDFGISAKACAARAELSILRLSPGDAHDPARHPPADRLAAVRGIGSDRSDGTVRGPVAPPELDLSPLRQDGRTGSRPQGIAADAGCEPGRGAGTRCPACAGRLWPGSPDGGCRGARLD